MSMPADLPAELHSAIVELCSAGDHLAETQQFEDAIGKYNAAWEMVPAPKTEWNASTWVLAAIADACFLGGFKTSAREALEYAMHCPGGIGNPFLHLRLGQVLLDTGEQDRAVDELALAYMGAGDEIFADQDAKYLDFLRTRMIL
jgi:hypothetical protein